MPISLTEPAEDMRQENARLKKTNSELRAIVNITLKRNVQLKAEVAELTDQLRQAEICAPTQ